MTHCDVDVQLEPQTKVNGLGDGVGEGVGLGETLGDGLGDGLTDGDGLGEGLVPGMFSVKGALQLAERVPAVTFAVLVITNA